MAADDSRGPTARHRPRILTVFAAAFVAGAGAAVGVNRAIDVHLAQSKPQVECEPIFVALRSLPEGTPITVWDVALRDWPKAMLPAAAVRATDSFAGWQLRYPLREGQPLLASQLREPEPTAAGGTPTADEAGSIVETPFVPPVPATQPATGTTATPATPAADADSVAPATVTPAKAVSTAVDEVTVRVETAATEPSPASAPAAPDDVAIEPTAEAIAVAATPPTTPPADAGEPPVAAQPTPASPPAGQTLGGSPAQPPSVAAARLPGDIGAPFDVPPRPPVDLESLPSVMSREAAAPAATDVATDSPIRYLVVPERIARQADNSFTTPVPPTIRTAPAAPQAAVGEVAAPAQSLRAADGQARNTTESRRPSDRQTQASRRPLGGSVTPKSAGAKKSAAPTSAAASRPDSDPGTRAGLFPNVSAGLQALGSWRTRTREAVAPEPQAGDRTQR